MNQSLLIETAKAELQETLTFHGGDTKNHQVKVAIEKLCSLNPTTSLAQNTDLLGEQWLLLSVPNFPKGKLLENGKWSYTLGDLNKRMERNF